MTEQSSKSTSMNEVNSYVTNPFTQHYKIEDWVYENATHEIKEVISELQSRLYNYPTIDHLENLTQQIKHSQLQYVKDAIVYYQILTKRLYKAKYSSFNQWGCNEVGMTSWRIKQIIEAGGATLKLIAAGFIILPRNSSQAYALAKLDDERLVEVWETVLDIYEPHEITAEKILLIAYPPEPTKVIKDNYIKIAPSIYEQIVLGAFEFKITINDYIKYLIEIQKCKFFLLLNLVSFRT